MRQGRALSTPTPKSGALPEIGAPVEVRHHPAARRMTLRVSRTRRAVIVTLPVECDPSEAAPFIHRHIDWVRERLDSLPEPVAFRDQVVLPLRGEPHRVGFAACRPSTPCERSVRRGLVVAQRAPWGFPELLVSGTAEQAPRRLKNWLFAEAGRDLDRAVQTHAQRLKLKPKKIAIRDQTSRWGSCSTTGLLSFSWRLILAPPFILDYVAAHEVAHLAEMNHGPRFWALVRKSYPRLDEAQHWLQVFGMDLHRYGVEDDD